MRDGAPRSAIAFNVDSALRVRRCHQVIQDNIQAQPWRNSVSGGVAHEGWAEVFVSHRRDVALHQYLGFAIWGHRIERRGLIEEPIPRRPVSAARGGEDKALHASLLGELSKPHR